MSDPQTIPPTPSPKQASLGALAAANLIEPWEYMHLVRQRRKRRPRRPSLASMIKAAKVAGVDLVVGGAVIKCGSSPQGDGAPVNPWDEVL